MGDLQINQMMKEMKAWEGEGAKKAAGPDHDRNGNQ